MFKRICIVLAISLAIVTAGVPIRTAKGILMTEAEVEMLNADSTAEGSTTSSDSDGTKKGGNRFVRVMKAPFSAIGRLFGFGRKKDNNKISRMSEKDAKKFESSATTRVLDARTGPTQLQTKPAADKPAIEAADLSDEDAKKIKAREHLEYGRQLLTNGDLNGAIGALSTALTLNPKLRDAHNLMGIAYEAKGLRNHAFQSFELALKGDDDDPEHINNLGYLYFKNGEYENALKYIKRAVKREPANQRYWNNLGLVQAQIGKYDDAYKSFVRASGELEGHLNIAIRLQRQGLFNDAIRHFELARALRPNSTDILDRLITLYDHTGRTEDAQVARSALTALRALATTPDK